jgi:hypothetical protein
MRQRQRRADEARRNASRWKSLLSDVRDLFSRSKSLANDVEESKRDIERSWEETASDIAETRSEVSTLVSEQASDRRDDASFDGQDMSGPPQAVDDVDTVHGSADLPGDLDYEIPNPVTEAEIESMLREVEEEPAEERERPIPFTERGWFELHSESYPISEAAFSLDPEAQPAEVESQDTDRERTEERADRRETERRRDSEDER